MNTIEMLILYSFFVLPLAAVFVFNLLPRRVSDKIAVPFLMGLSLLVLISAVVECIQLLTKFDYVSFSLLWDMKAANASFFYLDLTSCVVIACTALSVLCAALVAKDSLRPEKEYSFVNLAVIIMLAINGMVMVTDLFSFYVFLEVAGICAFILVALNKDSQGLEGSFKYFLMSALATAFLLIGMAFIFMNTGSLAFAEIQAFLSKSYTANYFLFQLGLCFVLVGLCIKAGITPFHGWVPDAYQSAPASVSVLMGGIVTKACGIYALIRVFGFILPDFGFVTDILMIFALLAICFGAFTAMAQSNFKRILAYSSISQLGYIVLAVAVGTPLAIVGAVLHFVNHSLFKGSLFVNADAIERETGTLEIAQLGGLGKQMPVTNISSVLSFLSAAGIPPLSGFWSKFLIILAAWLAGFKAAAAIALIASLVTIAYFLRLQKAVFFGKSREEFADIKESSISNKAAAIVLSALTVAGSVLIPVVLSVLKANGLI